MKIHWAVGSRQKAIGIRWSPLAIVVLVFSLFYTAHAQLSAEIDDGQKLARLATSSEPAQAQKAIADLRAHGPEGLKLLFQTYSTEINAQIANPLLPTTPEWQRISNALDAVSQQKNSYLSGLYWYTDFGEAKRVARSLDKPILELRLLGNLNEEFSCANSRFFRTILYANPQIANVLRERFVLHWQSERPAPRVTIDFGNGRKLERTLTGNSIHYVLDSNGQVIDALPGLYGPEAFLRSLDFALAEFHHTANDALAKQYDKTRLNELNVAWYGDIQKTGGKIPDDMLFVEHDVQGTPTAVTAARYAMTKMMTEASILRSITEAATSLGTITDQPTWTKIARLHEADAQLDARSLGLIKRQTNGLASDTEFEMLVRRLEQSVALDTVRNEYTMHTRIYGWLMMDKELRDVDKLNKKVYAELFLTPARDPWLGLYTADVYTGLDGGGITK